MRQILILCICLLTLSSLSAQEITVERPPFSVRNNPGMEIEKVVLNDQETVLFFTGYNRPGWWIRIVSDTYIRANDQKLTVLSAQGIELDEKVPTNEQGEIRFSLTFPPIDPQTKQIDFIESDCEDCYKIWGIELHAKELTSRVDIPDEIKNAVIDFDDQSPLPVVGFKPGVAKLKGVFAGYRAEMKLKAGAYLNNPVTAEQEDYPVQIREDGTFELNLPVISTTAVLLQVGQGRIFNGTVMISPGEETLVYFDLQQKDMQESRTRIDKTPASQWIFFGGANANLNAQSASTAGQIHSWFDYGKIINDIYGKSADEYKTYILNLKEVAMNELKEKRLSRKAYELACVEVDFQAGYFLMMGNYFLQSSYRRKHKLNYEDELTGFEQPAFGLEYFDFLKEGYINNPLALYSNEYAYRISACRQILYTLNAGVLRIELSDIAPQLMNIPRLTPEEKEYVRSLTAENASADTAPSPEQAQLAKEFQMKYENEIKVAYTEWQLQKTRKLITEILGTDQGIVFDFITLQSYARKLEESNPLTASELNAIARLSDPLYLSYVTSLNEKLLAQIELNKSKKAYNIHEAPESEGDSILHEIVKPFKGKVLFIDFWATWCGPCRSAMKQFEPAKEQFKEKDVVFIYLTDESSPKETWDNMIPGIPGEHYRLKNEQFSFLKNKFGVKGIPSYLILNKEGDQVYFRVGFEGAAKITEILNRELEL